MQQTAGMIIAQIGKPDGGNASTTVTDQVCLRRCMVMLQQLQLWLLGASASLSQRIDKLQLPCAWLQLQPVCLPLTQLRNMLESIFPLQIMSDLPLPSTSAAKINLCYIGSSFERHIMLTLLHPCIKLPLDDVETVLSVDEQAALPHEAWCRASMFMHTLHCLRMALRKFVQGFSSSGKPSYPESAGFLSLIHDLQVCDATHDALDTKLHRTC